MNYANYAQPKVFLSYGALFIEWTVLVFFDYIF